jgi:hypothetical protein
MALTNEEQIIELLREIRDLQKGHFERYQEYTEKLLEVGRQQEQERQQREAANQAELRRGTQGLWVILAIALFLFFFLRPIGDWLLTLFSK